jgi:hypothetical protein
MSTTQFITKQHVKYYWKVMKGGVRQDTTDVIEQSPTDGFWQYEQTPRYL